MKKLIVYMFVFVLALQLTYAGEIFNSEVYDNQPFTVNDIEHIARYYPSASKASIQAGTDRVLVGKDDCQNLGDYTYCLDAAVEGVDDETGDPSSTMTLRVMQSGPEIEIDRTISDDEPELNEEVEITATITNTGNERASNVNYEDNFPNGVKVSTMYYNVLNNGVLWSGSLNAGKSQEVKYKLKFQDFVKYESKAKASFLFNNKVNKVYSDEVLFEVKRPYKVTDSLSTKSAALNEEIEYTLIINHTSSESDLKIEKVEMIPPAGTVTSHRSFGIDLDGKKLVYTGKISGEGAEEIAFKFKSSKASRGDLVTKVTLVAGGKTFTEEFKHTIGMGVSDIMPEITFSNTTVKGGSEIEVEAKVVNNGENTIDEISIDMQSDLLGNKGWRHIELDPEDAHYAFNKLTNAPAGDKEKTYFVKLSGSYKTESGNTMEFEDMQKLTVLAQEKLVDLTPTIKKQDDGYNVTLKIKNVAEYPVTYVSLIDTIPKGFKNTAGDRYIDIDELAVDEELIAYSYIIKAPDTFTEDSFTVTHIFNGLDSDEDKIMTEIKTTFEIDESEPQEEDKEDTETNNTSDTESSETADTEEKEEESKPGVFTRMWRWIKGIFSSEDDGPEDTFE